MSKIIPVIHTLNLEQVQYNVKLCADNGIDSIFLIDHRPDENSLKNTEHYIDWIREDYPSMLIGANYLHLDTKEAIIESSRVGVDYLWADRSYIDPKTMDKADDVLLNKHDFVMYFGCVAFKYQKPVKDLEWTCRTAVNYMDVITTSGEATGHPPSIEKIKNIKRYIGNAPLAIASGINADNKNLYSEYTDYFLVASSITNKIEIIEEFKLKEFLK